MTPKFTIIAQTHLQVSAQLYSYLWFGASLKNIQKLPAKSLQLRETDSGEEESAFTTAGQGHGEQNNKK